MATHVGWILGWRRYTLIGLFCFLEWVVVSIFQWTDFGWIYLKCLSHVEFRTTQTDTQILHSAFIGDPSKTLFVTMEEDDNKFKVIFQCCNGFATCKVSSG